MRFKLLSLLLIAALSACSFQVDVIETPLPSATVIPVDTATSTAIPTPDNSATPPPLSETHVSTQSSAISTFPPPDVLPIVFSANATSQIVVGSVPTGASQTYALTAMQGQIMAISILPEEPGSQGLFQLEIKGRDGTVLCPIKEYVCPFWRGVLPSTQEYSIKVTPQVGGVFKMLVAISPLGQANQLFNYGDPQGRFTLSYSDEFGRMYYNGVQASKFAPEFALQYIVTKQYVSTNLSEAYFLMGSSTDPQSVSTCTEPASVAALETVVGTVEVNGVVFTKSESVGAGAGNMYEQIFYRTAYKNTCYEITYFIHSTNVGNYTPGTVNEFDRELLLQTFDNVLSRLVLK